MRFVTLCSGGLDSVTLATLLKARGHEQTLLFVDYGQKHLVEHRYAYKCAVRLELRLEGVVISGGDIFESALTSPKREIPLGSYTSENLAMTVVPNRNAVLANLAAALAVSLGYDGIALAIHTGDHEVYPDCRPEFVAALRVLLRVATGQENFQVSVPFLPAQKYQIVLAGDRAGVPFEETWSCYRGGMLHCGMCSTCIERKNAFEFAGVHDPTEYEELDESQIVLET